MTGLTKSLKPTIIYLICVWVTIYSTLGCKPDYYENDNGYNARVNELFCVEWAITSMMAEANPAIHSFEADSRVVNFADNEAKSTNNMSNGGLVTIHDDFLTCSEVNPPSEYLKKAQTEYPYWIEDNGKVHQMEKPVVELTLVQLAVNVMMADPIPSITNLETDNRILDFARAETQATNNMGDGGLIDIADNFLNESVMPVSEYLSSYLESNFTGCSYWVESNGNVHQVLK